MRKVVVSEWVTLEGVFDSDTMEQWFIPYHSDDHGEWKASLQRRDGYDEAEACQNQNVQLGGHSVLLPASKKFQNWRRRRDLNPREELITPPPA